MCALTPIQTISFCDFSDEMSEASPCGGENSSSSLTTEKTTVVQKLTLQIS